MKIMIRKLTSALLLAITAVGATAADILSVRDTITDPHIVYPESFEADTHKMMQNWYIQNYTELARGDYGTGSTVEPTDNELIERLLKMPTIIEMPFNSVVKSYIKMYVDRRRTLVENMLGMSTYYMPIFEQALEQEGVPLELKYLPIIESALNPNAVSRAGATGLWQFMLPTARGLGMEINSLVDERRDPVRSSQMAARYLKQLYDIYGDWSLAIAAYNCGPGNVNKALRRAGEDAKKDFWAIYPFLPAETRGYVPGFIAANYAMTYYDKHNISPALARRPIITDSVYVKKRVHFQQIADVLNIPIDEIRTLNPQYRKDIIPGDIKAYPLVLPSHQALCYIISEDSIVAHNASKYARRGVVEPSTGTTRVSEDGKYIITEEIKFHKVKRGDTFSKLARRYGVTIASIKKANGIKTLRSGRTIKIVTTKKTLKPEEPEVEITQLTDSVMTDTVVANTAMTDTIVSESVAENTDIEYAEINNDGNAIVNDSTIVASPAVESDINDIEDYEFIQDEAVENEAAAETFTKELSDSIETADSTAMPANVDPTMSEVNHRVQSTFNSRKSSKTEETVEKDANNSTTEQVAQPAPKPKAEKSKNKDSQPVYHKVKRGETLSKIAQRYGTTIKKLRNLNGIKGSKINIGQRIRVK